MCRMAPSRCRRSRGCVRAPAFVLISESQINPGHIRMGAHTRFAASALLAVGVLLAAAGALAADAYPSRPIKIIVPYAVGGATDLITRVVAQSLAQSLGVSVVVENRAGGGGTVASKAVS